MSKKGFTLIELMIVVAIIATIASIAIPNLIGARRTSNENAALATCRSLGGAAVYKASQSACQFFWDSPTTFGNDFSHVTPKAGYRFTYLSNGTAPSAVTDDDNATKFVYIAGPVSTTTGTKAYFIDETQTIYEEDTIPDGVAWDAPAVADWSVEGADRVTTPAGITWTKK